MIKRCKFCDSEFNGTKIQKCCSKECSYLESKSQVIREWKLNPNTGVRSGLRLKGAIREYLLNKSNNSCSNCGWNKINPISGKSPLEIDHIDGNCENAEETNLRVLCPNCHSLTPTWKSLNSGKGNRKRHSYFGLTMGV